MTPLKVICFFMDMLVLACAGKVHKAMGQHYLSNSIKDSLRATDWLSPWEMESLPSLHEMTVKKLEGMTAVEAGEWIQKMYHLSQAGRVFDSTYMPKATEMSAYFITPDNQKVTFKLSELPKMAKEYPDFATQEVTFFITGLPEKSETIKKAYHKMVYAYMQRYYGQTPNRSHIESEDDHSEKKSLSSSEEHEELYSKDNKDKSFGTFVVIELGELFEDMNKYATLDVENTGAEIGNVLALWTDEANVPHEIIHVIGSNIGAHVAGAVGRQFIRVTGHQLRRITGLDPSRIFAQTDKVETGLARGDAEFVDAIHTSAYGMGTPVRSGDVDFYANDPSEGVPGADNVIEASMRAILYFAESVVPGNERNFPAVAATSLQHYKNRYGYGRRVYMGINADYDVKGDYILQVNPKSAFGRDTPAMKHLNYHNVHKPRKTTPMTTNEND